MIFHCFDQNASSALFSFQTNLSKLPPAVAQECVSSFMDRHANKSEAEPITNFLEWLNQNFGEGIAKHFMVPYNKKFWNMPLEELSYDWAKRFIVVPSVEELMNDRHESVGYHASFYYPRQVS